MTPELARVLGEAKMPDLSDESALKDRIVGATSVVKSFMKPSPLRFSSWLTEECGLPVWLKLECLNPNGSFKVRGALAAIHKKMHGLKKGAALKVCAASAGNHAQGVALAARLMGCEAHIFLPKRTPLVKQMATERLGAKVYLEGDVLEEAFDAALSFAKREGAQLIHAFNDFEVILGQSSCAVEALEQFSQECPTVPVNQVDMICCVGGGGLVAGAGLAFKAAGAGRVYGAQQELFDSAARSFCEKKRLPVSQAGCTTIADGIAVGLIGNATFEVMQRTLERMFLVSDDEIVGALLGLL